MNPISYKDKIFPNQDFFRKLFDGNEDSFNNEVFKMLNSHDHEILDEQKKFKFIEHDRIAFEEMSTPPAQVGLIKFFLNIINGKSFLEIGTFVGSTAIYIASYLGKEAKVVTIEKFNEFAKIAKKNIKYNGFSEKIKVIEGDAKEKIKSIENKAFDLIYVDGDKGNYLDITKEAEKKISDKGLILIDDIFFHGDVFNKKPKTDKGLGCKETINYYSNNINFYSYILPINNGLMVLKKK